MKEETDMKSDITKAPVETTAGADEWPEAHGSGDTYALECAAAVMLHLGNYLLSGGKKNPGHDRK